MVYNESDTVAILLATYNGASFLAEQLNSILAQTYKNWICYIHDDGSTDESLEIAKQYQCKFPEHFCVVEGSSCCGAKENFLFLMSMPKEKYIAFCDQDDYWVEDKLEVLLQKMKSIENEEKPCLVFSDLKVTRSDLSVVSNSYFNYSGKDPHRTRYKQILIQNFVPGCSMLINKRGLEVACLYNNKNNIFMHDWWVILVCSSLGILSLVERPLVLYRQHNDNSIGADRKLRVSDVVKHIFSTLFGDHLEDIKMRIEIPRKFACELLLLPGLEKDEKKFLEEFSTIRNRNKLFRINFYVKNRLFRSNHRNLFMLLFV